MFGLEEKKQNKRIVEIINIEPIKVIIWLATAAMTQPFFTFFFINSSPVNSK